MKALLLSKDLLFISRIKEVAASGQRELVMIKTEAALREALETPSAGGVVLIDIEKSPLTLEQIQAASRGATDAGWKFFGFFSHVNHEVGKQAQALLGAQVMPRSRFVQALPEIIGL